MSEDNVGASERAFVPAASSRSASIPDAWPEPLRPDHVLWDFNGEQQFEDTNALAVLLAAEQVFINAPWWEEDWPERARKQISVHANCNDIFAWGCSDAETVAYHELEDLYRMWLAEPHWGTAAWCVKKRGIRPQAPVELRMKAAGYDIDALIAQGMGTRSAETSGSVADESAARQGAPETPSEDPR